MAEERTKVVEDIAHQTPLEADKPVSKRGNPNFVKGVSGNPKGRTKGATNKITNEIRDTMALFVKEKGLPVLFDRFESMTDRLKVDFVTKILTYVTPTLSAQKNEIDITNGTGKIEVKISYGDEEINQSIGEDNQADDEDIDYEEVDK